MSDSQSVRSFDTQLTEGAALLGLILAFKKIIVESTQQKDLHSGVTCDFCDKKEFQDYRYKCVYCKDYNLCGECYELKKVNKNHMLEHPMVLLEKPVDQEFQKVLSLMNMGSLNKIAKEFQDVVHPTSKCQICQNKPIKGLRFQCEECFCYDQCWTCYQKNIEQGDHKKTHQVIVFLNAQVQIFDVNKDLEVVQNSIGQGHFGKVSIVKIKSLNEIAALKVIDIQSNDEKSQQNRASFEHEIQAYNEIRCWRVVKYYGYQIDEIKQKLYIVMEYLKGGSLQSIMDKQDQSISLRRKFQWLLQISKGLRRMHFKKFIHKDIKPDNILLTTSQDAKIADMGVSSHTAGGYSYDFIAPRWYSAPEVLLEQKFSEKADIFQLGLLANHIFTYQQHQIKTINNKIEYHFSSKAPAIWNLIEKWTDINPKNRPTSLEVEAQLERIDRYFWKNLPMSKLDYIKASTEIKNKIFINVIEASFKDQIVFLKGNFNVLERNMTDEVVDEILQIIYRVLLDKAKEVKRQICQEIGQILNQKYGKYFIVFMSKGQMDGYASFQKNFYLCVQIDELKFTIFKTPQS